MVDVADDKQAVDIVMLDIRGISNFADYFVIMTAESTPQMRELASHLEVALKRKGRELYHREGSPEGGWVLLDFSDVIIHILRPEARDYYQIEKAWAKGVETVRIL